MRVEQRIGRIDRLGQRHALIRIFNLHYEDTVETDVYRALRERINLFETVVGRLRPILAQLPRTISAAVLSGGGAGREAAEAVARQADEAEAAARLRHRRRAGRGFRRARSSAAAARHGRSRARDRRAQADAAGVDARPMGPREYGLLAPGMEQELRVTTDPAYYEQNAESVELWSPGNPLFQAPEFLRPADEWPSDKTLGDVLDSLDI